MYKKIYVEITNNCNLNCSFCIKNKRENKFITKDEFSIILEKLQGFTKYLYFHVLGEPLMHPYINELIDMASKDYFVNITTNGFLIKRIENNKNIRQINISLHSFNGSISLDKYLENIFLVCDKLAQNTYINYRMWTKKDERIIRALEDKYKVKIEGSMKLTKNIYFSVSDEFIWPDLDNDLNNEDGKCLGLIDQFGILVDGTIIPCCMDSKGDINLGNIYRDNLKDILKSKRVATIKRGFKNGKRIEELCKHCGFKR